MKQYRILLALILCLALSIMGNIAMAAGYTAGTYTAEADGNNGPVQVSVTVSADAITAVEVLKHSETVGLSDAPIANIPAEIVKYQSLAIDTISGATNTSNAILTAAAQALTAAGADVEALKAVEVVKAPVQDLEASYDVVVLGGGGAGLTAAITAAQNGAKVIILEKTAALGGNTLIAGQGFNSADPGRQQTMEMHASLRAELESYLDLDPADFGSFAGVLETVKGQIREYLASGETYLFDTPELHMVHHYMGGKRTGLDGTVIEPDFDLINVYAHSSLDALNWMESIGATWADETITILGSMWPRSHQLTSGNAISTLKNAAEEAGVEIMYNTTANELIVTDDKVSGVKAVTKDGANVTLTAGSVVLATGGFAANPAMVAEYNNYWPGLSDKTLSDNAPALSGDGIVMAKAVGADLVGMGFAQMIPGHPVDGSLFSAVSASAEKLVFINQDGKRFVNEYAERDVICKAALSQTSPVFYMIADKDTTGGVDLAAAEARGDLFYADTLEALAEKIGVPADAFVAEIERYNGFIANQFDEDFGKTNFGEPIDEAPFVASHRTPVLHHTMGGVKIDTETHVIDTNGSVISGLYAAGEVCGGIHAGNRLGGNAMTDFLVFGHIAGENAALNK